jgi:ABC-2 type transport system ATP-binding protein
MRVELRSVAKSFGRVSALRGVSLDIQSGRRVALLGPNGSGKSTLTRAIMGLIAFEGDLLLDGRDAGAARGDLARRIAYVPQVAPHLAASAGELVRAVTRLRGLAPDAVARVAAELELDLNAIRTRPFRDLSGGMKQKLLIALALATDASLLILDEPTASLDPRARETFFRLFETLGSGRTLLLCSHRLEELARLIDHVVLLEEGRIAWEGSAENFLDARAATVVEVRTSDGAALAALGFTSGRDGWWSRGVPRGEAADLTRAVMAELGDRIDDVVVRNLEAVDMAGRGLDG